MKRGKCLGVVIHFEAGYFVHFTLVGGLVDVGVEAHKYKPKIRHDLKKLRETTRNLQEMNYFFR